MDPVIEEPSAPSRRRRGRRWGLVALAVLLIAGALAAVVVTRDEGGAAKAGGPGRDEPPAQWDPRLDDLVSFVERERGLEFDHPVRTDFLTPAKFRAQVTNDDELTPEDEESLEHVAGLFRALGLVEGELDLRDATNELNGEEIVGLYNPEADRIIIRGDQITPGMRPTLVHELTHALQAQHYDLVPDHRTSGQDTAFTALVEADAVRVQDAYVASLDEADRQAVQQEQTEAAAAELQDVPAILTELFSLPYVLGPPFLQAVEAEGGERGIHEAFEAPPTTEEHIIDPASYLGGDTPSKVTAPRLAKGEKAVGEADDFGMLSLLLVLGERLPFSQAWTAAHGWRGDASIGFQVDGRDCIRVRTQLDTEPDAEELLVAVRAWAGDRDVTSERRGDVVDFTSCDPGTGATGLDPARPRTFELLQLRFALLTSLTQAGLDEKAAACAADAVLREHEAAELLEVAVIEDPLDERLVKLQRDVVASVERCRAG